MKSTTTTPPSTVATRPAKTPAAPSPGTRPPRSGPSRPSRSPARDGSPDNPEPAPGPAPASAVPGPAAAVGLVGWSHLEPVLLAALATADPILLIGPHGTAKSMVLERLARALGLEPRFYNASLINYDDLIGIPMPNAARSALHYLPTPGSIWGAEVVFIDELNRTRIDLQNKLFPIIHERRVQGIDLPKLRYRWAAMNPPSDDDNDAPLDHYQGCQPLDPALADRFAFLISVPDWADLDPKDARHLLDSRFSESPPSRGLADLVRDARRRFHDLADHNPGPVTDYLLTVESLLRAQHIRLSARRLAIMQRSALGIRAALECLRPGDERPPDWDEVMRLTLTHCLPTHATDHVETHALWAVHRNAWTLATLPADSPWRQLVHLNHPVDRLCCAVVERLRLQPDELGSLVTDALASIANLARRTALAVVIDIALRQGRPISACAIETLADCLQRVRDSSPSQSRHRLWTLNLSSVRSVRQLVQPLGSTVRDEALRRLLLALLPDGYHHINPESLANHFSELWQRFRLDQDGAMQAAEP